MRTLVPAAAALSTLLAGAASAGRLPVAAYTTADGLAHDRVHDVTQDAEGYVWLSTAAGGLSRFDGREFVTYGPAEGLPIFTINQMVVAPDAYRVATNGGGVWRFAPGIAAEDSRRRFRPYAAAREPAANRVNVLRRDRAGRWWAGTDGGLFEIRDVRGAGTFAAVPLGLGQPDRAVGVWSLAEDARGRLWIATTFGLVCRLVDGRMARHAVAPAGGLDFVRAVLPVADRLWVGHQAGLFLFDVSGDAPRLERVPLRGDTVRALLDTADALWVGTSRGLRRLDGPGRGVLTGNLIERSDVRSLFEDRDGQVWAGTQSHGALRITPGGFSAYGEAEGLGDPLIVRIFESLAGEMYVQDGSGALFRYEDDRFRALPAVARAAGESRPAVLQDGAGEWWVAEGGRLSRYGAAARLEDVASRPPRTVYTTAEGLPAGPITGLNEDSRRDLWVVLSRDTAVVRWERATGRFHRYGPAEGLDARAAAMAFAEDRAGNLWFGLADGGLARFRDGRFRRLGPADGLPPAHFSTDLMVDRAGRLWVALAPAGVGRIDDPGAERPRIAMYTTDHGLSPGGAKALGEDHLGRIYIGSASGVDLLDPATGDVQHYTTADGLASNEQEVVFRSRAGALWFGAIRGLSRLDGAMASRAAPAVPARIGGLRIAGVAFPVADLGQPHVRGPELEAGSVPVEIDFLAVDQRPGAAVRYRHRLAGRGADWSAPSPQRTVTYAGLAAGDYRFEVQAVGSGGAASAPPAAVTFTVLQPVWRRPWVLGAAALAAGLAAAGAHRARTARVRAVERVRTRIATDLHDDIGSSLSRIAIMGEVVRRDVEGTHADAARLGGDIAESARSLLAAAGDIVWSIDPRRDELGDLAARVRAFGADLFEAKGIGWRVDVDADAAAVKLDPERRRHVFLIVKEALHNALRHAQASVVGVRLRRERRCLVVEVRDDGRGFAPQMAGQAGARGGHGLRNLESRAAALGGRLEVFSRPGEGTRVRLELPLRGRA